MMSVLGACSSEIGQSRGADAQIGNLPDAVVEQAAPNQDLTTARLRPEDGCYWYEHTNPVETILVPLRTAQDSRICIRSAS